MSLDAAPTGHDAHRPSVLRISRVVTTRLPTRHGVFGLLGYAVTRGPAYLALTRGLPAAPGGAPLVRIHSECLTGDALGSLRCDCGAQLDAALAAIDAAGAGALIYARGHEGRGIGLLDKLRAYALQDEGVDTVDANRALGLPVDTRDYGPSARILLDLGLTRIRLLSSNPAKQEALERFGITVVERLPLRVAERPEFAGYVRTKRRRLRHDPAPPEEWDLLRRGVVPAAQPRGELTERYGPLVALGRRFVVGQLGQSIDGFIASRTGDSRHVTGAVDREHLHRLRALVDAVVVGAGTVLADDCRLTVRAIPGRNPTRVVIDPHARIPASSAVLTDGAAPTIWLVGATARVPSLPGSGTGDGDAGEVRVKPVVPVQVAAPHMAPGSVVPVAAAARPGPASQVRVHRMPSDGPFMPEEIRDVLAGYGLGRVLVEGGGITVSGFLAAGVLDRLYLTTAPILIGDGVPGIRFDGAPELAGALTAPARRFALGMDVCVELDLAAAASRSGSAGPSDAAPVTGRSGAAGEGPVDTGAEHRGGLHPDHRVDDLAMVHDDEHGDALGLVAPGDRG